MCLVKQEWHDPGHIRHYLNDWYLIMAGITIGSKVIMDIALDFSISGLLLAVALFQKLWLSYSYILQYT